jgi:hypothetical protein
MPAVDKEENMLDRFVDGILDCLGMIVFMILSVLVTLALGL